MYATCLFCSAGLGRNDVVEHFPVGRRLAFDSARGRLWVVCTRCHRWNLTPLEDRWEAIEECERQYRATLVRVSTDNVGLARLRDGTDVVRVGAPIRPEFAAWRYGTVLQQRWRRTSTTTTAAAVAGAFIAPIILPTVAPYLAAAAFMTLVSPVVKAAVIGSYWAGKRWLEQDRVVAQLPVDHELIPVRIRHLHATYMEASESGDDFVLHVPHDHGEATLAGPDAFAGASRLLARANSLGADASFVRKAVDSIERAGSPEKFLGAAAIRSHPKHRRYLAHQSRLGAMRLAPIERLALEMAVHESAERRALEGELAELEQAWKRAEEIAAISDDLLLPPEVNQFLDGQR